MKRARLSGWAAAADAAIAAGEAFSVEPFEVALSGGSANV